MKIPVLKNLSRVSLIAGAIYVAGCTTTVNTVERAEPTGRKQMVKDKRVITDPSLERKVSVIGINEDMTPGGMLQVQVEVWNQTNSKQSFDYSFQWFDAAGMQVQPTSVALLPCTIEGQETRFLSSVAPTSRCRDFRVKFIESSH
jgi:uncharacterized protein YcfL